MNKIGGGKCRFCKSEGTNASTCPLNMDAKSKNYEKHYLAPASEKPPKALEKPPKALEKPPKALEKPPKALEKSIIETKNIEFLLLSKLNFKELLLMRSTSPAMKEQVDKYLIHLYKVKLQTQLVPDIADVIAFLMPPSHATAHEVFIEYDETPRRLTKHYQTVLTKIVKNLPDAHRGDFIITINNGYRNEGVYMWDGVVAVDLAYSPNEEGTVPPIFVVSDTGFTPDYWIQAGVLNNDTIWLSKQIRQRAVENIRTGKFSDDDLDIPYEIPYANIKIGDENYTIIYGSAVSPDDSLEELIENFRTMLNDERYSYHLSSKSIEDFGHNRMMVTNYTRATLPYRKTTD